MAEKYTSQVGSVATGTDKTIVAISNPAAAPTSRGRIADLFVGFAGTPGDQAALMLLGRITAAGTAGSSFTPNNLDPAGPAGAYASGLGVFTTEPTYTSNKSLLQFGLNQRATFRWVASPGYEIVLAATQNNGAGLKSSTSTSTQAASATLLWEE